MADICPAGLQQLERNDIAGLMPAVTLSYHHSRNQASSSIKRNASRNSYESKPIEIFTLLAENWG
jgi:hypothetical protein